MKEFVVCAVPFSAEDIPVITNLTEFIPEYVIGSVVTPTGLGLEKRDIGTIENRDELGYVATSNMEDSIKSCNIVLILSKDKSSPLYDYSIKAIEEAIKRRKDIICLLKLDKEKIKHYREICEKQNISFRCLFQDNLRRISSEDTSKPLYRPYAPVIFIGELAKDVQGYEVFCNLVKMCRAQGLKVSAIGPEAANDFFGFHTIDFSDTRGELSSCIYRINKYVRAVEEQENPSVIIINLPKPMIKFNEDVRYDFGLSAYMISQAIPASFFIACSPYGFFSDEFWNSMSNNFQSKFGYGIDAIHISNKVIDDTDQSDKSELSYVHMPIQKAQAEIQQVSAEYSFILGSLTDSNAMKSVVEEIKRSLLHSPYGLII